MDVLFVCTGNICRSPMATALFNERCLTRDVDARATSAGITFVDRPATDEAIEVMARRGIDIRGHRSRILDPDMVGAADLIIGMARMHVRESVVLLPESFPRSFTLKELARWATTMRPHEGEQLDGWLGRAGRNRRPRDLLGEDLTDDIDDPFRQPLTRYYECATEIDDHLGRVVDLLRSLEPAEAARSEGS